jgi:hypothetical protein
MNAVASSAPIPSASALPTIYEANRATDGSDAVLRGAELTQIQAIARRKTGADIVVCGADTPQNDRLAHDIEAAAAGGKPIVYHGPQGADRLVIRRIDSRRLDGQGQTGVPSRHSAE